MATLLEQRISRCDQLACSVCGKGFPLQQINTFASCDTCGKAPLIAQYDIRELDRSAIDTTERSMWRYRPMLPVIHRDNIVSLGEGWTPLLPLRRTAATLGLAELIMKDESLNPTCSFKARGMSMAISKAKELGIENCIVPTAGNAGGAMAAYCARAGMKAVVVMPRHTPKPFQQEVEMFGAELVLVDGLISDCAKKVRELNSSGRYFDLSTMKEPYRLEGKKTMGYEIAEQLDWSLPEVILYPTGGGTGLIGMWKAFHEMIQLGWLPPQRLPKMFAVQSENCEPIVKTWIGAQHDGSGYVGQPTIANGLAVPNPFAEKMILQVLHESEGKPVAVSDHEIQTEQKGVGSREGMFIAPEGAAMFAALRKLIEDKSVQPTDRILLLNTGSGYKYV